VEFNKFADSGLLDYREVNTDWGASDQYRQVLVLSRRSGRNPSGEAGTGLGAPREIRGALNWANGAVAFSRQLAGSVQPMLINGAVGLVWAPRGRLSRVLRFSIADGKIAAVDVIADPARLHGRDLAVLND